MSRRVRFACMRGLYVAAAAWVLAIASAVAYGQGRSVFPGTLDQHPAINYRDGALTDGVSMLRRDVTAGAATLQFDGREGYLRSLLAKLQIPIDSQILL